MKNKKIFFLINSLEWWWAERVVVRILPYLAEKFEIDLITLKDIKFYNLPKWVNYIPLSKTKSNFKMLLNFFSGYYYLKLKKLIKKNNYDNWISFLEFSNFLNILANKDKAIISFRTFFDRLNFIYKFLIKKLYPKARIIVFNSKENENYLKNLLNLKNTLTIYNPINIEEIDKQKKEKVEDEILNFLKWKKIFITVGRLIKIKHQDKIIKALSKINDNWWLLVVWDWPEKKNLEDLVKKLWVKNKVKFLWKVKNVYKYLNISKYFIYASEFEWFPNAVLEAVAVWLPIVTSNFKSGVKELVNPELDILENINYPYWGPNWVILDLNKYEKQFKEIYLNLENLRQERKELDRFNIENVAEKWKNILYVSK